MKSQPLLLNAVGDPGRRLARLQSQANDPKDEGWLQALLYAHPELLPVEAFDDSYGPAIPIGRETPTDRGPIDNLYISPEGRITIVETKLWKNPEKHRTVVAQIIDYAKEMATWDYDQLCNAVLASSRRLGESKFASLEEKAAPVLAQAGLALHEFQEGAAACLSEGRFLLLIVGDRISPNIALLTKAIQSAPGLAFTIGLAEMQLYAMEQGQDWPLIVVPEVVGRTVEKTRGVVQVRYQHEKPEVAVEVDLDDDPAALPGKLDLDVFLSEVEKDLAPVFQEAIQAWEQLGGRLYFTEKTMYFEIEMASESCQCVRCRTHRITVIPQKMVEQWTGSPAVYQSYLEDLSGSSILSQCARNGKLWIGLDQLSADDLRTLLRAARNLVERVRDKQ